MRTNATSPKLLRLLTLALPFCASSFTGSALAVDAVGGSARNSNVVVPGPGWTILTSVSFINTTRRYCVATGSADAFRPTTTSGSSWYAFTVSNTANPPFDQGQERTLEFLNQGAILDNRIKEITTTGGWMANAVANPGYFTVEPSLALVNRTLYFLARKTNAAYPNLTVADASMTVVCTDNRLAPIQIIPGTIDLP